MKTATTKCAVASRIDEIMARAGVRPIQRVQQLYHDREEVTAYLTRHD